LCVQRRVRNLWLFMSLPTFFFGRVSEDIRQQMDGILALTEQLSRQRLPPDAEACVSGVAEAASAVARLMASTTDLRNVTTGPAAPARAGRRRAYPLAAGRGAERRDHPGLL
jgi:hypothetical protein